MLLSYSLPLAITRSIIHTLLKPAEQIACEVEAAEKAKYQSSSKVTTPQAPVSLSLSL